MSFYTDFASHYESIFPVDEGAYRFLLESTPAGGRVLDIGCGTGGHCGRMAQDGHECVGVDVDPEMVAAATEAFPEASFRSLDMEDVGRLSGTFGCVYSIGNVLSHLPGPRLTRFLESVAGLVEPGGSWIFQTVNWDYILGLTSFRFPDVEVSDEGLVFEREYPSVARQGTPFVTRLRRFGEPLFEGEVTLYPVTSAEYLTAHEGLPFDVAGHYAGWEGRSFDAREMSSSVFHFRRRSDQP